MTADPAGLTVVAGHPTAEELAALTAAVTAVLAARSASGRAAGAGRQAGGWADRARLLRAQLVPGPGAWRRSARPLAWLPDGSAGDAAADPAGADRRGPR
jgi:hypothetical protein